MEVVIVAVAGDAAAGVVADVVDRLLGDAAHPVIGLATGSSPLGAYRRARSSAAARGESASPPPTPSCSTSTSASRRGTPRRTARSSAAS